MNNDPVIEELKKSKEFKKRGSPPKVPGFYLHVANQVKIDGLWLEFGTGHGSTIVNIIKYAPDVIYTFDWFQGLPEDWILSDEERYNVGSFGVIPVIINDEVIEDITIAKIENIKHLIARNTHNKAIIIDGLFEDSLPVFIEEHPENCAFIHVDCDLYSSTKTILNYLDSQIVPGTVILFDEFYNYVNYRDHEYKAFLEFIERTGFNYEFIAHVSDARQAAVILK